MVYTITMLSGVLGGAVPRYQLKADKTGLISQDDLTVCPPNSHAWPCIFEKVLVYTYHILREKYLVVQLYS